MTFELTGTLYEVYPAVQVTEKFMKREFVVKVPDGDYEQYLKFQLTQRNCALVDRFQKNDAITVRFSITGKPFVDRNNVTQFYNNLQAFSISGGEFGGSKESFSQVPPGLAAGQDDDLPF